MTLSEKMFDRSVPGCGFATECRHEGENPHFDGLFSEDWEVFVIKRDAERNKYNWFTLCCELPNGPAGRATAG